MRHTHATEDGEKEKLEGNRERQGGFWGRLCLQRVESERREKEELDGGFFFWSEQHPSLCTESSPASVLLAVP